MVKVAMHAELVEYHKLAATYYDIFSLLFRQEFTAEFWRSFRQNAATLPAFATEQSSVPRLAEAVKAYDQFGEEQQLVELANLFAREFLTMGGKGSVSLAQSVYTSPKQMLCQNSFFSARAAYHAQGVELESNVDLTDDNLAVILSFMAYHAGIIAGMPPKSDIAAAIGRQNEYRALLLSNWLDALVQRARGFSQDSLYTILLEYLNEFVRYDAEESLNILSELKE